MEQLLWRMFTNDHSIYFVTGSGVTSVLEWFPTMQEAIEAAEEMKADGRFLRISSHIRSQETADA